MEEYKELSTVCRFSALDPHFKAPRETRIMVSSGQLLLKHGSFHLASCRADMVQVARGDNTQEVLIKHWHSTNLGQFKVSYSKLPPSPFIMVYEADVTHHKARTCALVKFTPGLFLALRNHGLKLEPSICGKCAQALSLIHI